MSDNINTFLKPIQKEGQIRNDKDKDDSIGVEKTWCSTFLLEKHILVKGEFDNPKSGSRTAMMNFHDAMTGDIICKSLFNVFLGIFTYFLITRQREIH
jgi:hypothetical protein